MPTFFDLLDNIIKFSYKGVEPNKDTEIGKIQNIENNLGIKLPEILASFYVKYNEHEILEAFNHFQKLEDLEISDGYLIIAKERQESLYWGLPIDELANDDPSVKQYNILEQKWYDDCDSLNSYLISFFSWQAVNKLPALAESDITPETLALLQNKYKPILYKELDVFCETRVLLNDDLLMVLFESNSHLYVGAHDDEILEEFEEQTGVDLSWS